MDQSRKQRPLTVFPGLKKSSAHESPTSGESSYISPTEPKPTEAGQGHDANRELVKGRDEPPRPPRKDEQGQSSDDLRSVRVLYGGIWTTYRKLLTEKWAGAEATIAASTRGLVAIRQIEASPTKQYRLKRLISPNIVDFREIYLIQDSVYIVYEYIDVSLLDVASGQGGFNEMQVAFVCKELLQGLSWIHDRLHLAHGNLDCNNVLVTSEGRVKIGNVADCQLIGLDTGHKQRDYNALGTIMIKLLLPGFDHSEAEGKLGEKSSEAQRFYEKISSEMSSILLEDPFLNLAEDSCLVGPTLFASRYKLRDERWLEG